MGLGIDLTAGSILLCCMGSTSAAIADGVFRIYEVSVCLSQTAYG